MARDTQDFDFDWLLEHQIDVDSPAGQAWLERAAAGDYTQHSALAPSHGSANPRTATMRSAQPNNTTGNNAFRGSPAMAPPSDRMFAQQRTPTPQANFTQSTNANFSPNNVNRHNIGLEQRSGMQFSATPDTPPPPYTPMPQIHNQPFHMASRLPAQMMMTPPNSISPAATTAAPYRYNVAQGGQPSQLHGMQSRMDLASMEGFKAYQQRQLLETQRQLQQQQEQYQQLLAAERMYAAQAQQPGFVQPGFVQQRPAQQIPQSPMRPAVNSYTSSPYPPATPPAQGSGPVPMPRAHVQVRQPVYAQAGNFQQGSPAALQAQTSSLVPISRDPAQMQQSNYDQARKLQQRLPAFAQVQLGAPIPMPGAPTRTQQSSYPQARNFQQRSPPSFANPRMSPRSPLVPTGAATLINKSLTANNLKRAMPFEDGSLSKRTRSDGNDNAQTPQPLTSGSTNPDALAAAHGSALSVAKQNASQVIQPASHMPQSSIPARPVASGCERKQSTQPTGSSNTMSRKRKSIQFVETQPAAEGLDRLHIEEEDFTRHTKKLKADSERNPSQVIDAAAAPATPATQQPLPAQQPVSTAAPIESHSAQQPREASPTTYPFEAQPDLPPRKPVKIPQWALDWTPPPDFNGAYIKQELLKKVYNLPDSPNDLQPAITPAEAFVKYAREGDDPEEELVEGVLAKSKVQALLDFLKEGKEAGKDVEYPPVQRGKGKGKGKKTNIEEVQEYACPAGYDPA